MRTKYMLFFLFCSVTLYGNGGVTEDTLSYQDETIRIHPRKFILPASFILIGSWGVCNGWLRSVNRSIRNDMAEMRGNRYFHADDYIQYVPVILHLGLGVAGVESKHSFKERIAVAAVSYLAMGIMVNGMKRAIDEKRPDSSARNSFPSGHTATVFMGAEQVRMEYGTGYGIGAYGIACGVAFLRLYNDRHWLNDVVAGAGIGILSARIGYWLLPFNRKLFKWKEKNTSAIAVMPTYNYYDRCWGLAFTAHF